jgi:microcystin-dependent protein
LGFGTWVAFGAGRVPVGFDSGNPLFDTAEETGGSANATVVSHDHTYSATTGNQSANHTHSPTSGNFLVTGTSPYALSLGSEVAVASSTGTQSADHTHNVSGTTASTGSSGTNANYQPYITVYMWKRTA